MKFEAHMVSGVHTSKTPLKASSENEAVAEFRRLRTAHGESEVFELKLIKVSESGEEEISVS